MHPASCFPLGTPLRADSRPSSSYLSFRQSARPDLGAFSPFSRSCPPITFLLCVSAAACPLPFSLSRPALLGPCLARGKFAVTRHSRAGKSIGKGSLHGVLTRSGQRPPRPARESGGGRAVSGAGGGQGTQRQSVARARARSREARRREVAHAICEAPAGPRVVAAARVGRTTAPKRITRTNSKRALSTVPASRARLGGLLMLDEKRPNMVSVVMMSR